MTRRWSVWIVALAVVAFVGGCETMKKEPAGETPQDSTKQLGKGTWRVRYMDGAIPRTAWVSVQEVNIGPGVNFTKYERWIYKTDWNDITATKNVTFTWKEAAFTNFHDLKVWINTVEGVPDADLVPQGDKHTKTKHSITSMVD